MNTGAGLDNVDRQCKDVGTGKHESVFKRL